MKAWFEELLAEDDLTMDNFVSSVKTYNLPGDYRNMLVKPGDVTWKVVGYDDATEDLLVSDKESMEKTKGVSEKIDSGKS
jgi:tRNA pseudouridine13 synthase